MKREIDVGVDGMQVVEHLHVEMVVLHGHAAIFRRRDVDADEARIDAVEFEADERLREYLNGCGTAADGVDVMKLDSAGG